ncbi:MAG: cytochrome c oxidase subunit II [Thermoanaerobaculia bacterium]
MWKNVPLFPEQASTLAGEVDALYFTFLGISVFFGLLVAGLVVFFAIRFRRRSEDEIGRPEKAGIWLEVTWSVVPLAILLTMFAWGAKVYVEAFRPPGNAVEYFVTAKQWMWKFQHPQGNREINVLHVPLGQPIRLTMTSEDVIHSFFVPAFRVKADVLPGRYTTVWFEASKVGTFHLFCAEYCGAEHSVMGGDIVVMNPADYELWLAGRDSGPSVVASGEELFRVKACNTCHRPDSATLAPILHGIFGEEAEFQDGSTQIVDENYLRESILNPTAKLVKGYKPLMPTYKGQLTEEEVLQLIGYIKSLASDATESQGTVPASGSPALDSDEG